MLKLYSKLSETLGFTYPKEHAARIDALKRLGEQEIHKTIDEILTKPQYIVDKGKMLLTDALKEAVHDGQTMIQIAAPLLTFPRATPEKWNGDIDHVDTITGTYSLFTGNENYYTYGDHLLTKYKGGPTLVPFLRKALGEQFNITMKVDTHKDPASRIILVFPKTLAV
jgi:hypothetical protein